jgi:hypothetical protein
VCDASTDNQIQNSKTIPPSAGLSSGLFLSSQKIIEIDTDHHMINKNIDILTIS